MACSFDDDDDGGGAGLTSVGDSMNLTAAVDSYTQHSGFILPFEVFAF